MSISTEIACNNKKNQHIKIKTKQSILHVRKDNLVYSTTSVTNILLSKF